MDKVRRPLFAPNQTVRSGPIAYCTAMTASRLTERRLMGRCGSLLLVLVSSSSGWFEVPSSQLAGEDTGRPAVFLLPGLSLFPCRVLAVDINGGQARATTMYSTLQHCIDELVSNFTSSIPLVFCLQVRKVNVLFYFARMNGNFELNAFWTWLMRRFRFRRPTTTPRLHVICRKSFYPRLPETFGARHLTPVPAGIRAPNGLEDLPLKLQRRLSRDDKLTYISRSSLYAGRSGRLRLHLFIPERVPV